jgi:hypothetical protein
MREYVIDQLRKNASVRGKQRTWISELTDEQIYQLFQRLRSGENAKSVARYLQKAWGVLPESTPHSVSQGILKFKRRIAHLLLDPPPDSLSSPAPSELEQIYKLEGSEGMERIAQLQLERIHRMMVEERETGIRHTGMSREIHSLSALMKSLIKAKEWDMVHEGMDPVKRRRLEEERRRLAGRFTELMDGMTDEGRNAVVAAAHRFLELAEEHAVEVEIGPDGEYRLVKPDEEVQKDQTRESSSSEQAEAED